LLTRSDTATFPSGWVYLGKIGSQIIPKSVKGTHHRGIARPQEYDCDQPSHVSAEAFIYARAPSFGDRTCEWEPKHFIFNTLSGGASPKSKVFL